MQAMAACSSHRPRTGAYRPSGFNNANFPLAAGAMNFENQGVIKRLADQYGPENLTVILGNGEANGVEVFAETVTEGDPSYAGPLAGVALKIPVYHILEDEVMSQVPESLREEKLQLSALVVDVDPMHQVLEASRKKI